MFPVIGFDDLDAQKVYGLVQLNNSDFSVAYVSCEINLDDYDETHTLKCRTLATYHPTHKKIIRMSQV